MKKLFLLLFLCPLLLACSSDDEDDKDKNNLLVGTKWTATNDIAEFIYGKTCTTTIEFLDNSNCQEIDIRKGMKYGAGTFIEQGTYTIKGDSVIWIVDGSTMRGKVSGSTIITTMKTMSFGQRTYIKE